MYYVETNSKFTFRVLFVSICIRVCCGVLNEFCVGGLIRYVIERLGRFLIDFVISVLDPVVTFEQQKALRYRWFEQ